MAIISFLDLIIIIFTMSSEPWSFYDDQSEDADLAKAIALSQQTYSDELSSDEVLARKLQDEENSMSGWDNFSTGQISQPNQAVRTSYGDKEAEEDGFECFSSKTGENYNPKYDVSLSLSDPQWEVIDPTPNIHALFIQFNHQFFWGKLDAVEVGWSKRMTTCAGICYYQSRTGHCRIGLSQPLLTLRPRKDLVETLIHEMIHALLFVTRNNKDHDGHGPEFHKHMYRINAETGLKISVYHTFHDEVRHYKRHAWLCNGPCRNRPPFFGKVRRASNRAPGPNDLWWKQHQDSCGGSFVKVEEPEEYTAKKKREAERKAQLAAGKKLPRLKNGAPLPGKDIRAMWNKSPTLLPQSAPTPKASSLPSLTVKPSTSVLKENTSGELNPNSIITGLNLPVQDSKSLKDTVLNSGLNLRKLLGDNPRLKDCIADNQLASSSSSVHDSLNVLQIIDATSSENETSSHSDQFPLQRSAAVTCPVCGIHISEASINLHLDSCLS